MIRAAEVLYKDTVQGEVLHILDPHNVSLLETVHLFEKVRTLSQNATRLACFFELRPCNVKAVLGQEGKKVCPACSKRWCATDIQRSLLR